MSTIPRPHISSLWTAVLFTLYFFVFLTSEVFLQDCLLALDRPEEAQTMRMRTFAMDLPRAETCCEIGAGFMAMQNYRAAAYWYERALACRKDERSGAFVQSACYDYVPLLQLCVCYDRLGERALEPGGVAALDIFDQKIRGEKERQHSDTVLRRVA